ncbi:hypothetical protein [Streptomyces violascens]|uniref:Uncharacterized protein n=1 Tax=Streptomyces violascens TaxID=67381 RepID=A0ABQ3QPQ3_9ACTN|nr:hypothetical protein [Streptomyces violascens]GGU20006.1 hypothetical protein GCM10010289_47030 [Streptomyces violascens]GHI39220.1 hypothetical protein Sviol_36280 [Streptomyces violascens]
MSDLTDQNTAEAPQQPPEPATAVAPPQPAEPPAPLSETPPAAPKDRRVLRAALRWTAAVAVFGVLGTGIAYGITVPERTDVPGLSTKSDGRWAYPKLVKPALPAGGALPYAAENPGMIHYADLEQLLLPAPAGSTPDPTLKGDKSRITTDRFLQEFAGDNRVPNMRQDLAQGGLRQIAARGWTMPDGTATRIYLVRFHTSGYQNAFTTLYFSNAGSAPRVLKDIEGESALDDGYISGNGIPHVRHDVYVESAPTGPVQVRHAYIAAGDIVALVVQSKKGTAAAVPFHQTAVLQEQLLG